MISMHRHSRAIRLFCWVVVTLSPMLASGVTRDQAADLGVSFMVQPNTYLLPGSVGSVIVTVTNHGPDTVSAFVVHSSIWADGQQILLFPTPETQCDFGYGSYDGPVLYYYASLLFQSAPLPPGAQQSCTIGLSVYLKASGQYALNFNVSIYQDGFTDPNPTNDLARPVTLYLSPISVPALGNFGLLLMALLIALLGWPTVRTLNGYCASPILRYGDGLSFLCSARRHRHEDDVARSRGIESRHLCQLNSGD